MKRMTLVEFKKELEVIKEYSQKKIDEFTARFKEHQVYAMTWSDSLFEAVTRKSAVEEIQEALSNGATLDDVEKHLTKEVLQRARFPQRSTSVSSNLVEQYLNSARAELLARLQRDL